MTYQNDIGRNTTGAVAAGMRTGTVPEAKRDARIIGGSLILVAVLLGRMARKVPVEPLTTGDSYAYQYLLGYRPPLYGWLINAWQAVTGGIEYLPMLQLLLLGLGLFVFAVEFSRMLRSALVPVVVVPVVLMHPGVHDAARWMMTEAPYLTVILLGLAMQCRYVRRGDAASLVVAAGCFALATLTRSTGFAFLPLPLLAALCDRRIGLRLGSLRAGCCAALAALCLLIGMTWTWARAGHFELGSWAGISLLGKALVLARPGELPLLPPPLADQVAAAAGEARRLTDEQPDFGSRLRAQVQASSDVRYAVFWPAADTDWPEWIAADGRAKDQLARDIAGPLVARHRIEYLTMVARDWAALVLHPAYWPAWLTSTPRDPHRFAACAQTETCWGIERYDLPIHGLLALIGVSVVGTLASLLLIPACAWAVLRRRADPAAVLMWGGAMVVHGTLLITAAAEAGHMRYTIALHVLDLMLVCWLAALAAHWSWREVSRAVAARACQSTTFRKLCQAPSNEIS